LHALELPELVTESLAEYEALALILARDPARLQTMRDKFGANLPAAPLFDRQRFCDGLETAYRKMSSIAWTNEAPRSFSL
jgi:protein O-GlcNAc transferase